MPAGQSDLTGLLIGEVRAFLGEARACEHSYVAGS
jgi:hypothetical protein